MYGCSSSQSNIATPLRGLTCYIWSHNRGDIPTFTPAEACTRFSDPGEMQGWVDLSTIAVNVHIGNRDALGPKVKRYMQWNNWCLNKLATKLADNICYDRPLLAPPATSSDALVSHNVFLRRGCFTAPRGTCYRCPLSLSYASVGHWRSTRLAPASSFLDVVAEYIFSSSLIWSQKYCRDEAECQMSSCSRISQQIYILETLKRVISQK